MASGSPGAKGPCVPTAGRARLAAEAPCSPGADKGSRLSLGGTASCFPSTTDLEGGHTGLETPSLASSTFPEPSAPGSGASPSHHPQALVAGQTTASRVCTEPLGVTLAWAQHFTVYRAPHSHGLSLLGAHLSPIYRWRRQLTPKGPMGTPCTQLAVKYKVYSEMSCERNLRALPRRSAGARPGRS